MCGIAGIISLGKRTVNSESVLKRMLDVQNHRGPDDRGVCGFRFGEKKPVVSTDIAVLKHGSFDGMIGHNRLSILDLSEKGRQPMLSKDERVILAFNGEIYNAFDYREDLMNHGIHFHSRTDTEVILEMYQKYGFENMLSRLNGMFAIAIVDLEKRKFYLARDRFGIKPIYFSTYRGKLTFASELKCFLCDPEFEPQLDESCLYEHLIYHGTDSHNLMKNVDILRPGEVLEYTHGKGIKKYSFFNLDDYERPEEKSMGRKEYQRKMQEVLEGSVRRQMVSDVKVGCQMSGGIDSTLITTFASKLDASSLKDTISVIFDEENKSYSEEPFMDMAQKKLKLSQHKLILNRDYVGKNLYRTIWHLDTMANTPNSIGIMLLSEEAKKYVTVLLSGEGADEAFAGYWQFTTAELFGKYWEIRRNPLVNLFHRAFKRFDSYEYARKRKGGYDKYVVSTFGVMEKQIFRNVMRDSDPGDENYKSELERRRRLFNSFHGSDFDKHIKYMMTTNLPDLLVRQDKMSMAASIENRVPFLDNEVVDFAFSLPKDELLRWYFSPKRIYERSLAEGKCVLKDISKGLYGKKFTYRGKRGFDLPLSDFLSGKEFESIFYDEILPGMGKRGVLNAEYAGTLFSNLKMINNREATALFRMINLEIWCQLFLDKRHSHLYEE